MADLLQYVDKRIRLCAIPKCDPPSGGSSLWAIVHCIAAVGHGRIIYQREPCFFYYRRPWSNAYWCIVTLQGGTQEETAPGLACDSPCAVEHGGLTVA